jgi:hypothetical protein
MATLSSLVDRVRLELGDMGKSFVEQFIADGSTNRFRLHYQPLEGPTLVVIQNGIDISSQSYVEESTGVLITPEVPADGVEMTVSGTYYRYFTNAELERIVTDSVTQHSAGHVDSLGRQINVATLPLIEEYPVAIYATTIALYTLATDASFDIDIAAPDGVSIPRSERYRQLMDMVQARQAQYRDLCVNLGVGLYKIDVFTFRRISKATGRLVPVYKPQEVDDRSYPQRVEDQLPTYGDKQVPWVTEGGELTAYQGRAFTTTVSFTGDYDNTVSFVAKLLNQRGSVLVVQNFDLSVTQVDTAFTATMSLTSDQTLTLAERTYWSLQLVDPNNTDPNSGTILPVEVKGGNFFTARVSQVVL